MENRDDDRQNVERVADAGALFACELDAPGSSDALAFTGLSAGVADVTFNNNTVNFSDVGGLGVGTYTLFTFDADHAYSGTLQLGTGLEAYTDSAFVYNANSIQLNVARGLQSEISIVKMADATEEGPVDGSFRISRPDNSATGLAVTVYYTVAVSSTATPGIDYTALSGSVELAAGQTNAALAVHVIRDHDFTEGSETVMVTITPDALYTVGVSGSATVTIADGTPPSGSYSFTATYPFDDTVPGITVDPTPPPYEKTIVFGAFSMHGIGANGGSSAFYADGWPAIDALNPNAYMEVTFTPTNGLAMNIQKITFDLRRQTSGGYGPQSFAMRSNLDGYTDNLQAFAIDPPNALLSVTNSDTVVVSTAASESTWLTGASLTLGPAFEGLEQPVSFRIYGWNCSSTKDGGIDNVRIYGSAGAVKHTAGTLFIIK